MLDHRKIRTMTKLAVYEEKNGKEDIFMSKYYKSDYVRYQVLKSVLTTTIGYGLILIGMFLYKSEYIIGQAVVLDYKSIGTKILGVYIILVTIYGLSSVIGYSIKYDSSRKKLAKYYKTLRRLDREYNQ